MKILNAEQIYQWDAYTIKQKPIASIDLMEEAAKAFAGEFQSIIDSTKKVHIFCGPGNNGGDGLAIGRLLLEQKYRVEVYAIRSNKYSEDFRVNEQRLAEIQTIHYLDKAGQLPVLSQEDVVIDAILGSGLDRPIEGFYKEVVENLNASPAQKVAVDIASGLFADKENTDPTIVKAGYTLTFQVPKLSFFLARNAPYVGAFRVLDIGLLPGFPDQVDSHYYVTEPAQVRDALPLRQKFAHKGHFGHALLFAGSHGKMGAAVLAARACLRTGAGLLTTCIPACGYTIMQSAFPEAMVITDPSEHCLSECPDINDFTTVGIGPGLGQAPETTRALHKLIQQAETPLIIDADGLNLLAQNPEWLKELPGNSILTPHPGEFTRLAGEADNDYAKLDKARDFAVKNKVVLVLKGAHTCISTPEGEQFFNTTGNPAMAKGGSGDVLTGMITGLLAQGLSPEQAALSGVYLHGKAGELASQKNAEATLLASEIIQRGIPAAFQSLYKVQ